MKFYFTKTPLIFMRIFSKYRWRFITDKKEIFLTFDDGPTPKITSFVLNQLACYNAKATFFCLGKNIANNPTIFKQIIAKKHAIGNHTYNHLNGWKTTNLKYTNDIVSTEKAITKTPLKQNSKLFRPPYGKITSKQAKQLKQAGYQIIMWDVLSADFDTKIDKEECLKNVLKKAGKGSIIVFHDSVKAKEKLEFALPKVLHYFTQKGYVFKAIS